MNDYEKVGIPTILISGIIWLAIFIKNLMKEHRAEREKADQLHREERDKMFKALTDVSENSNKGLNELTNTVVKLNTLFDTLRRK